MGTHSREPMEQIREVVLDIRDGTPPCACNEHVLLQRPTMRG
jgi:hypothetical protein